MEWLLLDISGHLATAAHAIVTFVVWLTVLTITALVLVYNRIAKQIADILNLQDTPNDYDAFARADVRVETNDNQKEAA